MTRDRNDFLIIAQITDIHLRVDGTLFNGNRDTEAALAGCIDHLNTFEPRPNVVLATGDLVDEPDEEAYRVIREMLDRVEIPVYIIPGNHDDKEMVRRAFIDLGYFSADGPFLHYTVENYPLRLIGLDTLETGGDGAEMCPDRLRWLDDRLSEQPDRPTLIFMHHQPVMTRIGAADKNAFPGTQEMEDLVRRHSQVEWIVCGHLHRAIQMRWGGTVVSVAPSATFQRTLTIDNAMPKAFIDEPPAMLVHMWSPETGVISHVSLMGDFGAPYPMRDVFR